MHEESRRPTRGEKEESKSKSTHSNRGGSRSPIFVDVDSEEPSEMSSTKEEEDDLWRHRPPTPLPHDLSLKPFAIDDHLP